MIFFESLEAAFSMAVRSAGMSFGKNIHSARL
jgi:hypothetical protein